MNGKEGEMRISTVEIKTAEAAMPAHLAEPEGKGPFPGVVVIMEAFGLLPHICDVANRLAGEGYVALAPDFYYRDLPDNKADYDQLERAIGLMQKVDDEKFVDDMRLFGAAAQAGTLRIITNKPDPSQLDASIDVSYGSGNMSDASHNITGMINIPFAEVFAIRVAAQTAEDGGYIDNVLGHTPDTWFGETAAQSAANAPTSGWRCEQGQGDCVWGTNRMDWGSYQNDNVAEDNWNSSEFTALRVQALWNINDNWTATLAYHYGDTKSQGSSAYNPFVGDLKTIGFVKNKSRSEWDMAALTIEADLGFAQFVSATSFYENQRTFVTDNTHHWTPRQERPPSPVQQACETAGQR